MLINKNNKNNNIDNGDSILFHKRMNPRKERLVRFEIRNLKYLMISLINQCYVPFRVVFGLGIFENQTLFCFLVFPIVKRCCEAKRGRWRVTS